MPPVAAPVRRKPVFVAVIATLALHVGVLGAGALMTPAPRPVRVAEVLVGHVDERSGDFVAEGYARARVRGDETRF